MVGYDDENNALTLGDDDSLKVGDYELKYNSTDDEWHAEYGRPIGGELGNHGEIRAGASYTKDAQVGSHALELSGDDSDVEAPSTLPLNQDWTILLWFKPDNATDTNYDILYSDDDSGSWFGIDNTGNGTLQEYYTSDKQASTLALSNDTWQFVGVKNDASATETTFYLGSNEETLIHSGTYDGTGNPSFRFLFSNQSTQFADGTVDDVRIYNRELTSTEVNDVRTGTHITNGLVAQYNFEYPETPRVAIDSTGDAFPQNAVPRSTSGSLVPQGLAESVSAGEALADDGNTYSSVQTAVDNASGWVFVGPGTFDGGVTVSTEGMAIEGSGYDTFIDGEENSDTGITSSSNNVTIKNLRTRGDSNTSGSNCVKLDGASCTIDNVTAVDSDDDAFEIGDDGVVKNCTIQDAGVHGIRTLGTRVIISGCYIGNVDFDGVDTSDDNVIVSNNVVDNPSRNGIGITNNDSIAIGNRVIGAVSNGIKVAGNDNIIANNRVSDSGANDIDDNSTGTVFDGNLTGASN